MGTNIMDEQSFTNVQTIVGKKSVYVRKREPSQKSVVNHQPPKDLCESQRLIYQIDHGLLPPSMVQTLDIDRLHENEEDFLAATKRLAIEKSRLKPLILQKSPNKGSSTFIVQNRTIIGENSLFNEGHKIYEKKHNPVTPVSMMHVRRHSSLALREINRNNSRQSGPS